MSFVFTSKSALNVDVDKVKIQQIEVRIQYVVTVNTPDIRDINGLKYIELENNDLSLIYGALAVILCVDIYDSRINGIVCFSREYGVPLVWLGLRRPPGDKLFNFNLVTDNKNIVWRYLCQIK